MEIMIEMTGYLRGFNCASVIIRMLLACVLGALLGLNRERKRQAAGLRTFYCVCLGSVTTVLLSLYFDFMLSGQWAEAATAADMKTDVSRLAAQVISGIGFLGAGAILVQQQRQIKGLTTAAGLWAGACLGIAVGAGFYELVLCGFVLLMVSLILLPALVEKMPDRSERKAYRIAMYELGHTADLMRYLKKKNITINEYEIGMDTTPYLDVDITFNREVEATELINDLLDLDEVRSVNAV